MEAAATAVAEIDAAALSSQRRVTRALAQQVLAKQALAEQLPDEPAGFEPVLAPQRREHEA
jgi:hypothetical protein